MNYHMRALLLCERYWNKALHGIIYSAQTQTNGTQFDRYRAGLKITCGPKDYARSHMNVADR